MGTGKTKVEDINRSISKSYWKPKRREPRVIV
jgi:hypothetical protein